MHRRHRKVPHTKHFVSPVRRLEIIPSVNKKYCYWNIFLSRLIYSSIWC